MPLCEGKTCQLQRHLAISAMEKRTNPLMSKITQYIARHPQASLAEVGRGVGVSRERVRQLVNKLGLLPYPKDRLTTTEVARVMRYRDSHSVIPAIRCGRMGAVKVRGRYYIDPESLPRCVVCGGMLGKGRRRFHAECYERRNNL